MEFERGDFSEWVPAGWALENGVSRASWECEKAWLGECFVAGWEFERGDFGEWVTVG